jgi:hypothetical protein
LLFFFLSGLIQPSTNYILVKWMSSAQNDNSNFNLIFNKYVQIFLVYMFYNNNNILVKNELNTKGYNMELHLNKKFLHYRAATNWHSNWKGTADPLFEKTKIFNEVIRSILK